jgi:hypothetical protein
MNPQTVIQTPCPAQVLCTCSTQTIVDDRLVIPPQKPDIEQVMTFSVSTEVTEWKVIATPLGPKVIASGLVHIGVQYVAAVPEQSVHFAHFDIPWHEFFLCAEAPTTESICNVTACVEFAEFTVIDARTIEKTVILFLCATPCPPPCPPCTTTP